MIIEIERNKGDENQTLGTCKVIKGNKVVFNSFSLERGWNDNKKRISCIPKGEYQCVLEWSNRFKTKLWEIKGVDNRSECKFHSANYWYQLNGCISLGKSIKDINKDGYNDVTSSRYTMKKFNKALSGLTKVKLIVK